MREINLEGLPMFEDLTPGERAELEDLFEAASVEDGEVIFEEGGREERLYLLTSGAVDVSKQVFPGRWQRLAVLEAPAVVGEIGLLAGSTATCTVTARGQVEALRLSHEGLLERIEAGSRAAYKLVYEIGRILAERMASTDESIAKIVARLEETGSDRDFDLFREKLSREWSF